MLRYVSIAAAATWLTFALPAAAQDSTITYQGQLQENGVPFTGTANLQFQLYDALVDGSQVGTSVIETDWPVENGLFQVELDFGTAVFDGSERFLEVWVNGAPLTPRQAVRPAPIAVHALNVSAGGEGASPFSVNPTTGAIEYLFDDQVIRFSPDTDATIGPSPRIELGHMANVASAPGAVVLGGGSQTNPNAANGLFSTVSGGLNNVAEGSTNIIAGGLNNTASGLSSTVSGGSNNTASNLYSTVTGGSNNTASNHYSTVSGGRLNCAGGDFSWAGGNQAKVRPGSFSGDSGTGCDGVALSLNGEGDLGTFLWADSENADFVSTGPDQFLIRAAGGVGINTNAPATNLHLGGLNTDADMPDGLRLENAFNRSWDIHTSAAFLRFNYEPSNGDSVNVAYVDNANGSWNQVSDRRLKNDIRPIASVLERIAALEVVDYQFNHDAPDAKRQIGLIAQDVAKQFPELASREGDNGFLGVNYAGFSVVALKAIQEQQALIEAQQARIDELRGEVAGLSTHAENMATLSRRNAELEARLTALETLLIEDQEVAARP